MAHYNKRAFELVGVTFKEYEEWCSKTKKGINNTKNLTEFFKRIKDGKLARDKETEKIVNKRPRKRR